VTRKLVILSYRVLDHDPSALHIDGKVLSMLYSYLTYIPDGNSRVTSLCAHCERQVD
jgi:hypothetical protein